MADEQARRVPRKSKGWLAGMLALGLAAASIYVWLRAESSTNAATESTLALETFVVNLNGPGQHGYLRVGITLGLARPLVRGKSDNMPTALVRDTILSVLATAQPEQLLSSEGKRQIKENLLRALQERAPELAVHNVYFTEFLVQL